MEVRVEVYFSVRWSEGPKRVKYRSLVDIGELKGAEECVLRKRNSPGGWKKSKMEDKIKWNGKEKHKRTGLKGKDISEGIESMNDEG